MNCEYYSYINVKRLLINITPADKQIWLYFMFICLLNFGIIRVFQNELDHGGILYLNLQGPSARNSVEVVFVVFCFVITFAIVPEVSITLVMHLMSRDFWGMLW